MVKYLLIPLCFLLISCETSQKRSDIISGIRRSSALATSEFTISKTLIGKKDKEILWVNLNTATFVAYAQAFITMGIDLNKLQMNDIQINQKAIQINLPEVEILNFSFPFEKLTIDSLYTKDKQIFNHLTASDVERILIEGETEIRKSIPYLGLKEVTEENTRKFITQLLENLNFDEIYISFNQ